MINCYTDGSTREGHSGASVVMVSMPPHNEHFLIGVVGYYMGEESSPIMAELYAMKLALCEIISLDSNPRHLRICSDCQSAVDLVIGNSTSDIDRINDILEEIDELVEKLIKVEFQWVRGHNGNQYNEIAASVAYSCAQG